MSSWEEIGAKWNKAQQMGWQAIQAALDVGDELTQKKVETPHGEYHARVRDLGIAQQHSSRLMRLALHRELVEKHKPDSMRGALALLPKVPRQTSEKQHKAHVEDVEKYESFAKEAAKQQAAVLTKKQVKIEVERIQNQAHDAVMIELKAVKTRLAKERKEITRLGMQALEDKNRYQDLINRKMGGYDYKQGIKTLNQALHPDRKEISESLRLKAMDVVKHLSQFLGV